MNINEITFDGNESLSCALHVYSLRDCNLDLSQLLMLLFTETFTYL